MRSIFSRLLALSVPEFCGSCEGGSGASYDSTTGVLHICAACQGTGQPFITAAREPMAGVIDLDLVRQARTKAQHEVRKVA